MRYNLLFLLVFLTSVYTNAQTVSNMTLLGQKNEFTEGGNPAAFHYSACWGYTAPDGREYAFVGHYAGTTVYDITDAPLIANKGTIAGLGSHYNYREMKTISHYLYIVSEGGLGVQIVDLQYLPDSIHFVKSYTFSGFTRAHTISVEGRYLYVNGADIGNGGVFVLDCLDPENPVRRGQWTTRYAHDSYIKNDTIFTCDIYNGYLSILDARNKDSIKLITEFTYPGAVTHNAWVTEDRKHLVTTDEGGSNHAKIWNIQNLDNITQVADINPYEVSMVHNAYIKGDSLYLAHYRAGVIVYNIQNRTAPVEVAHYDTYFGLGLQYQGCWNVYPYLASGKIIATDISTGLYVLQLAKPTSVHNETVPVSYSLKQNYPNPFNPSTVISYEIPKAEKVVLKVYDALGRTLKTLIDARQNAGRYDLDFDASSLNSGVYFYTLQAGDFKETKKMLLVK